MSAARGDEALIELTAKFDRIELTSESFAFSPDEIATQIAKVDPDERDALELAAIRIRDYHARQMPEDGNWTDASGATLGWRWRTPSARPDFMCRADWHPIPRRS